MTDREWYQKGMELSDIGMGSSVDVLQDAKEGEYGWQAAWHPEMDFFIGKRYKVIDIGSTGFCLSDPAHGRWWFPFFVLKKIYDVKPDLPPAINSVIEDEDFGYGKEAVRKLVAEILKEIKK